MQLLFFERDDFNRYLGHLADAFYQEAEASYAEKQAQNIPAWIRRTTDTGAANKTDGSLRGEYVPLSSIKALTF